MSAPASGSATVSRSVLYPSILDDAMNGTIGNYHMFPVTSDSTSRDPVITSVPAGIGRHGPLPPPQGGKSGRGRGCSRGGTRRGSSCKSKKGGKKGVRRSASGKRCRRKGKRSRKAHRR